MISRRTLLKSLPALAGGSVLSSYSAKTLGCDSTDLWMPEEGEKHARTWMAFVANDWVWSRRQIPEVKRNLALIAATIAKYEPVSLLVAEHEQDAARSLLGGLDSHNHPIELLPFTADDLWLRDTGPTFVKGACGEHVAIDFNFNGWGEKQEYAQDAKVAGVVARQANAAVRNTDLVLEGGCFEVDGHGTAILTKSCVMNDNRNPGFTQSEIEAELKYLLGLKKIIWLEGIKGKDITDGHTDFYVRFTQKGRVLVARENYPKSYDYHVTRKNIEILKAATDADGKPLEVVVIDAPDIFNEKFGVRDFAAGYVGYYLCNGAVIMQRFGDKAADAKAKAIVQREYPDRVIEQIAIDGIASGGGSIHCATQQEPWG